MPRKLPQRDWRVHTVELTALLALDTKTISRFHKMGMPKAGRGLWDLAEVLQWIIALYRGDIHDGQASPQTAEQARKALLIAQAEKVELEVAEQKRELLRADDVFALLQEVATITAGALEALPVRAAAVLPGATADTIEGELDGECRFIGEQIANAIEAAGLAPADSEPLPPTPDPPRRPVGRRKSNTAARST